MRQGYPNSQQSAAEPHRGLQEQSDARQYLETGEQLCGLFAGVPEMGPHLVLREAWIAALVTRLNSGTQRSAALEGREGVGKTAVAAALAHRREVLERFYDGVLWAHLGRGDQANPMETLADWAQALGHDITDVTQVGERAARLKHLLSDKRLLLIIDDVWDVAKARALCCGGPHCFHLFTTRETSVAQALVGPEGTVRVTRLSNQDAFRVLEYWAPEACAVNPDAAQGLARAVLGLPLALELLGGYLRAPEVGLTTSLGADAAISPSVSDLTQRLTTAQKWAETYGGKLSLQETVELSLTALPQEAREAIRAVVESTSRRGNTRRRTPETSDGAPDAIAALLTERNLGRVEGGALVLPQAVEDAVLQRPGRGVTRSQPVGCTIGIMAYNEAATIGRLLSSLREQETKIAQMERIIVVASGCTDGTEQIVESYVALDPRITLLRQAKREGKASAVNLFMKHTRAAEVVVLCSADLLPVKGAIEALIAPFADPAIGMVGAHPVPTNTRDTFMGFGVNLLWDLHHLVSLRYPKMGELIAFRNIFRQIPHDTAVDEASIEPLIVGQGLKLHYSPDAIVYNHGPETLRDFIRQRRRIYTGHLYVKDTLGYQVSTMKGMRILSVLFQSLKPGWRYVIWTPAIIALEVLVRALGVYDYRVRKRNPFVWQMAASTKKGLTGS